MAEIPLRTYVEQLDNLIERKQVDEVIAHCRHLLGLYPKHLDTYRMLGKALLEKGRHGDAADIFQRVLSVMPDDFISHVGMSIVREDEANLDAAIWHMERAFEASPANGAIQQELCRLYGRRDGVVPAKVRLTRGALARMYAQGGLYLQAEAELKAALTVEADRIDLMTVLADVYWQTDQHAQAAQTAAAILQKLPYSIDANRILVGVLHAQERRTDAVAYRQRLQALDPYEAFADSAANGFRATQVDPAKVMVARLDYVPGMEGTGSPDWLASIGAKFEEPAAARSPEAQPDWLAAAGAAAQAAPAADYQPGQGSVPDWLKDLEAGPAADAPETTASPDWLREVEAATGPLAPRPGDSSEELPDWLVTATGPLPANSVPNWMLQTEAGAASDSIESGTAPLAALGEAPTVPVPPTADSATVPTLAPTTGEAAGELPDWLKSTVADETEEDLPDWLKAITAQPLPAVDAPTGPAVLPAANIPDWLKGAAPDAAPGQASPTSPAGIPDWLQTAAGEPADTGQRPELSTSPMASRPSEEAATAPLVPTAQAAAVTEPTPPSEPPAKAAETPTPEELPEWLKVAALAGGTIAAAASSTGPTQAIADQQQAAAALPPPALARASEDLAPAPTEGSVEPPAKVGPEAETVLTPAPTTFQPPTSESTSASDLPDWLQAATAVPEQGETPVWLQTAPAGPSLVAAQGPETPELEMPDWLKDMAASAPPPDATAAASAAPPVELPDFLQIASPEAIARAEQPLELEPEGEPDDAEPVALPADIPDWLKALAPSPDPAVPAAAPPAHVAEAASVVAETGDSLSWLDELTTGAAPLTLTPASEAASDELPDWLAASDAAAPETAGAVPGGLGDDTLAAEIPPWAQNEEPGPSDTIASWLAGKHVPDWLRQPANEAPSLPAVEWEPGTPTVPAAVDSLAGAQPELSAPPAPAAPTEPAAPAEAGAPELESMDAEAAFRWLEGLAAQQGARSEELFTTGETAGAVAGAATQSAAPTDMAPAQAEPRPPAAEPPIVAAEPVVMSQTAPTEPMLPAVEPPNLAAETPAPAEPGGLEEFLRQTEAAMPVAPLADTAPSKKPALATPELAATEPPALAAVAAATPPIAAEPSPAGEFDEDAALRWLEGLAAQQGANPEELLTAPEERTLEVPQWVAAEKAAAEPAATTAAVVSTPAAESVETPSAEVPADVSQAVPLEEATEPAPLPIGPAATPPATAEAPSTDVDADTEAAMRWLEGLAARQGANPDELLTAPEERTLEVPTWVAEQSAEASALAAASATAPGMAAAEEPPEPAAEAAPAAAPEPPEWLKEYVSVPEPAQPTATLTPAVESLPPAEPEPAAAPETPDWLKTLSPTEEPAAAPAAPPQEPIPSKATADLDKLSRLSERLAAARRAREAEMEARFAEQRSQQEAARRLVEQRMEARHVEPEPAPEPAARTRHTGPLSFPAAADAAKTAAPAGPAATPPAGETPAPATLESPALVAPAPTPARPRVPRPSIRVQRPRPASAAVAQPASVPASIPPHEALARGQAALSGQDYEAAVGHLSGLVQNGQHLDTVVSSLEGAVSAERAPVSVLRLLGDAYLRKDQLQKALDTYRQALSRL